MEIDKLSTRNWVSLSDYWTVLSLNSYIQYIEHKNISKYEIQDNIWLDQLKNLVCSYNMTHIYDNNYLDTKILLRCMSWQWCLANNKSKYKYLQNIMTHAVENMNISANSKNSLKSIVGSNKYVSDISKNQLMHLLPVFYKKEPKCYDKTIQSYKHIKINELYKLLTNSFRMSNDKLLKIFCKNNVSIDDELSLTVSIDPYNKHYFPVYYLYKCLNILKLFIAESYTKNSFSKIIQVLFVQQIKLGKALTDLIVMRCPYGHKMLSRIICEIYIKIKWLLNSPEPDTANFINYDRFTKYVAASSRNLLKQTIPYYSYIRKQLHDAIYGKLDKLDQASLKKKFNKMMRYINQSSINMRKMLGVGFKLASDTDLKSLYKGLPQLHINNLANRLDYKFYKQLSNEAHSTVPYILKNNTITKHYRHYINNNNEFTNYDPLIGYAILFISYSFYAIWSHRIFTSKNVNCNKIINFTEYNMQLLSHDGVEIIYNITGKKPKISYF